MLLICGGAAVGKTTVARVIAGRYGVSVLPVDVIWSALKVATDPASHPELHYFDPSDEDLEMTAHRLCIRHIESARAISDAMDPVIEYYLWERWPVVIEGAWLTPDLASRWTRQNGAVRAVFIHEQDMDEVLAAMLARSHSDGPTRRKKRVSEVCWLFGNWAREQALIEGLPVVDTAPHETLAERVIAAVEPRAARATELLRK